MQRRIVQRMFLRALAIALLMRPAGYGQSLGEVARENRDKQNADASPTAKPKVITNKDLPKDPDAKAGASETPPPASTAAASKGKDNDRLSAHHLAEQKLADQRLADQRLAEQRLAEQRSAQQRLAQQHAADQWKSQILAQKNKVASLQARVNQLKAWANIANPTVQYETYPYNRYQAQQLQRVSQIQLQLDEQKRKLDQMQDAARHAGMHSAVYDP
jgi:hypothetical protein